MHRQDVKISTPHGNELAAEFELPLGTPRGAALFAHCFTCGRNLRAARILAAALVDAGIAVLRFDFTGLGDSDGDFADTNFSSNVGDLVAAADWLRQNFAAPSLLVGHSLGGAAVIAAAPQIPEVTAVATIGAPSDPGHVVGLFSGAVAQIEAEGSAEVSLAGRPFQITQQFLTDVTEANMASTVTELGRPLLIMHAPGDTTVSIDNAERLFELARHPRSFVALDGADHLLSSAADATFAASVLTAWASRHVTTRATPSDDVLAPAAEGEVVVTERDTGDFDQTIRIADRHVLLADEPLGIGDDTGPAPYDLLLAGLGACTNMTLRMYAGRKGWPLEGVTVRMTHGRVHAKDCEECESESGQIDVIERELVLEGPLDDEQRTRLLEIADKCPVHRTLTSETRITTELVTA